MQFLVPSYFSEFSCIGASCQDTCCVGFSNFFIDKITYEKYQALADPELRSNTLAKLERMPEAADSHYALIKLDQQRCPFLDSAGWCTLQNQLGEDYLSITCQQYPRITNIVDDQRERSLSPSCIEAARLILLDQQPISFLTYSLPEREDITVFERKISTQDSSCNLKKCFHNLRSFLFSLLQNRQLSLSNRLIMLGFFLNKLNAQRQNSPTELDAQLESYRQTSQGNLLAKELAAFSAHPEQQLLLLQHLSRAGFFHSGLSKDYLETYQHCLQGLRYSPRISSSELVEHYQTAYHTFYSNFESSNGWMLENFLVNHVFSTLFPYSRYDDWLAEYLLLVVLYSVIRLQLIGLAAFHSGLEPQQVVRMIQLFTKNVVHNQDKLDAVVTILKAQGYNTTGAIAALIK